MKILFVIDKMKNFAGIERILTCKINYIVNHTSHKIYLTTYEQQSQPLPFPLDANIIYKPLDIVMPQRSDMTLFQWLKAYAARERIVRFVVGYPMNLDNRPSEAARDVDLFLKQLEKAFPDVPVTREDERFTSVLAHRAMIEGGMKKSDRRDKASVDKISAAIILQGFLDRQANNK